MPGCTIGPVTGQTIEATTGSKIAFSGYTDTKATPVTAYVMSNPNDDPAMAAFTPIGT